MAEQSSEQREHQGGSLSERPEATVLNGMPPPPTAMAVPPPRLEGYQVMNELGRGGMGVVYKALHIRLQRLVALKMLIPSPTLSPADWEELVIRCRREATALARVKHDHVIEIYDVGETAVGKPYLALELCPGGSLDDLLRRGPMPPREAAALVRKIALGVHAAHQARVVHRDLKPANVLLSETGAPKVTDFGLARKLDETGQTRPGAIFGTASYMAPEQAGGRGNEATPAADIYALGVILYECLTGRPPFQGATIMDTLLQVMNDEPASPRQLNWRIPRDLETIALKCLQKDPARRYASAKELADDLGRYEAGESIHARPIGVVERGAKWARRRPAITALLTLLAALVLGTGTAITLLYRDAREQERQARHQAEVARDERDRADEQRRQAEHNLALAREAVKECFDIAKDNPLLQHEENSEVKQLLLKKALPFFEKFTLQGADDPRTQTQLADHFFFIGEITSRIDRPGDAARAYQKARDLYAELLRTAPTDSLRLRLASTLGNLGNLWQGQGKTIAAAKAYSRAYDLLHALHKASPTVTRYREVLASVLLQQAYACRDAGEDRAALKLTTQAREHFQALARLKPDVDRYHFGLATSQGAEGTLLSKLARQREALDLFLKGCSLMEKWRKAHPSDSQAQRIHAQLLSHLASARQALGQHTLALANLRQALALQQRLFRKQPNHLGDMDNLARTWGMLGNLLREMGDRPEAHRALKEAYSRWAMLVEKHPDVVAHQEGLADAARDLGRFLHDQASFAEALAMHRQARKLQERLSATYPGIPRYQLNLAGGSVNVGVTLREMGKRSEARDEFMVAIRLFEKLPKAIAASPEFLRVRALAHFNLAGVLEERAKALAAFRQTLALQQKLATAYPEVPLYQHELAVTLTEMAPLWFAEGKAEDGFASFKQANDLLTRLVKKCPGAIPYALELGRNAQNRASLHHAQGKKADVLADTALAIRQLQTVLKADPRWAMAVNVLWRAHTLRAVTLADLQRHRDAVVDWDQAMAVAPAEIRIPLRFGRVLSLAKAGSYTRTMAEVADLEKLASLGSKDCYRLALVSALAVTTVRAETTCPLPRREHAQERYSRTAMALLRRARRLGQFAAPADRKELETDAGLNVLRQREDFRTLLKEILAGR